MPNILSPGGPGPQLLESDANSRLRRLLTDELRLQQQSDTLTIHSAQATLLQYLKPHDFEGGLAVLNALTQQRFSVTDLHQPSPLALQQAGPIWGRLFVALSVNFKAATSAADPAALDLLQRGPSMGSPRHAAEPVHLTPPTATAIVQPAPSAVPASVGPPPTSTLLESHQERIAFVRETLLLPDDPQRAAYEVNHYLADTFGLQHINVEKHLDADDANLQRSFPGYAPELRFAINLLNQAWDRSISARDSANQRAVNLQQLEMSHDPSEQITAHPTGAPLAARPAALMCPRSSGRPFVDPFTTISGVTVNRSMLRSEERFGAIRDHAMRSICDTWNTHCDNASQVYIQLYQSLCCPISLSLMDNPVLASDGMVYDLESIRPIVGHPSPLTRQVTISHALIPHQAIRALISSPEIGEVHCRHELEFIPPSPVTAAASAQSRLASPRRLPLEYEQIVRLEDITPARHIRFLQFSHDVTDLIRERGPATIWDLRANYQLARTFSITEEYANWLVNDQPPRSCERRLALSLRIDLYTYASYSKAGQRKALQDLDELAQDGHATDTRRSHFEIIRRAQILCNLDRHGEARLIIGPYLASSEFTASAKWNALIGRLAHKDKFFYLARKMLLEAYDAEPMPFVKVSLNKVMAFMRRRGLGPDEGMAQQELAQFIIRCSQF